VAAAEQVIIHKSRPFRMRFPDQQAEFFKLLSYILYYIVSGCSKVEFLAAQDWNIYYKLYKSKVRDALVFANS
jgi:hypothetical protein